MLKFIAGLATGALLTCAGRALVNAGKDREPVSSVDDADRLESAERLRATVNELVQKEKEALEALKDDMNARMEAVHAAAVAKGTASETTAEPASDSISEDAES